MQWYPWLTRDYQQIIQQHQRERAHHAQLIIAQPGMGADALVWGVARWLLCQQPQQFKACGQCHGCQLMTAHHHPDWHPLRPEKGKHQIGIDAVRETCEKLYYTAQQGGAKVVWIEGAEQLTEAAANGLLKTLEEPPEQCWFLLTTVQADGLTATLRSRCLSLYLRPPMETQSLQWLQQKQSVEPDCAVSALRLSAGAPGAALQLLTEGGWQQRQQLCDALRNGLPNDPMGLLETLNTPPLISDKLHWLISLLLDSLKLQQGASGWLSNPDQVELVQFLAQTLSGKTLQSQIDRWIGCRHQLLSAPQLNHELLLSKALLDWEQQLKLQ